MSKADLTTLQRQFAAHLRDPDAQAFPDASVEQRRIDIYKRLIFANVESFLRKGFPVLHSLYDADDWSTLVRAFLVRHRCESPYFHKIGEEFLHYLGQGHALRACDPPFMLELAHYEYMEVVVDCADVEADVAEFVTDDLRGPVVVSSAMCLLSYTWPVHKISARYRPAVPLSEPVNLLVYRDRRLVVRFMELSGASVHLLSALAEGKGVDDYIAQCVSASGQADQVRDTLAFWREQGIVLGAQPGAH